MAGIFDLLLQSQKAVMDQQKAVLGRKESCSGIAVLGQKKTVLGQKESCSGIAVLGQKKLFWAKKFVMESCSGPKKSRKEQG